MCGITGWVPFDRDLTRERETLDAMTRTMACRGPGQARAFPWIALNISAFDKDGTGVNPHLWSDLRPDDYRQDAYADALGGVSSGSIPGTTTTPRTTSSTGCGS